MAFFAVDFPDGGQIIGEDLGVEHRAFPGGNGGQDVVLGNLVRPFDPDGLDQGFLLDLEDDQLAAAGVLDLDLDVVEVAQLVDALQVRVDGLGVVDVALLDGQPHEHHVLVQDVGSADLDVLDALLLHELEADFVRQIVDGRQKIDEPLAADEERHGGLQAESLHQPGVQADGFAHLAEAAVQGVGPPGQQRQVAGHLQVQVLDVLLGDDLVHPRPGDHVEAGFFQPVRDELRQALLEIVELRLGVDPERQHHDANVLSSRLLGSARWRSPSRHGRKDQQQRCKNRPLNPWHIVLRRAAPTGGP